MATFTLAFGKTTNRMVREPTSTRMVLRTRETGSMTSTTAQAKSTGLMAHRTPVNTNQAKSTAMVYLSGKTEAATMVSSLTTKCMVRALIHGTTAVSTRGHGRII